MELLTRNLLKNNSFSASLELFTREGTYTENNFLADFPRLFPYITVNDFNLSKNEAVTASETMTAEEETKALERKIQTFFEKLLGSYTIDFPTQTVALEKGLKSFFHQAFSSQPINAVNQLLQHQREGLSISKPKQEILLSSFEKNGKLYIQIENIAHITILRSEIDPENNLLEKYPHGITVNTLYKLSLEKGDKSVLACTLEKASISCEQSLQNEFPALQKENLWKRLKQLLSNLLSTINPVKARNSHKTCFFFQFANKADTINSEVVSQQDKSVLTKTI